MKLYCNLQETYDIHVEIMKTLIIFKSKLVEECDKIAVTLNLNSMNDISPSSIIYDQIIASAVNNCYLVD
jgi:hypothetical protein